MKMHEVESDKQDNLNSGEVAELKIGEALLPYSHTVHEYHVRFEDSYTIDSRSKSFSIEGKVEDVMQILKYIKVGETND